MSTATLQLTRGLGWPQRLPTRRSSALGWPLGAAAQVPDVSRETEAPGPADLGDPAPDSPAPQADGARGTHLSDPDPAAGLPAEVKGAGTESIRDRAIDPSVSRETNAVGAMSPSAPATEGAASGEGGPQVAPVGDAAAAEDALAAVVSRETADRQELASSLPTADHDTPLARAVAEDAR